MTQTQAPTNPWPRRVGIVLTVLPALLLFASAAAKLSASPEVVAGFAKFGYAESAIMPLGIVELLSTILFLVPVTSVLGAILLTGYLGGATATHLSQNEPFMTPVIVGVVVWGALWLRYADLRALLPLRR